MPEETSVPKPRAPRKTAPKDGRSSDCTPAENKMWDDVLAEQVCRLDQHFLEEEERHIRASEFRKLCLSGNVPPGGVTIYGAVFVGDITLSHCDLSFGLDLDKCKFCNTFYFVGGSVRYLYLEGSLLEGEINAQNIDVSQHVFLRKGFVAKGQVDFNSAKIGGQFACTGGKFEHEGEKCLVAFSIDVAQDVFLSGGFIAKGQVDFNSAKIGGQFSCAGGQFEHKGKECLTAFSIDVAQDVFLSDGFIAKGQVHFNSAKVGGQFSCTGGQFEHEGEKCLVAFSIDVAQDVFLSDGFVVKGQVDFNSAKIGGQFDCTGGNFGHEGEKCLVAFNIDVAQHVFLRDGFVAKGQVDFNSAKIGGQFDCYDGKFCDQNKSIALWKAEINQDVFFSSSPGLFHSVGSLILTEAHIHGNLLCCQDTPDRRFGGIGGKFDHGIQLDGSVISGTFYFAPQECSGEINLGGATIGKVHDCYALTDASPKGWWRTRTRDIRNNWVDRLHALFPRVKPRQQTPGDERQKRYKLYGLRYKEIEPGMCKDWRELVEWIRNADGGEYHPQPYERLASVLHAQGHENEASEVLIARRRHRLQSLTWIRRAAEILLYDLPILFGYKPWQAIYIAAVLITFGAFSFHTAEASHLFVPSDGDVLTKTVDNRKDFIAGELRKAFPEKPGAKWTVAQKESERTRLFQNTPLAKRNESGKLVFVPDGYPQFNAAIYALGTFLPIIDLQQNAYWLPDRSKPGGIYYWRLYWLLDISGWFLTTLLVASLTGLVRERNPETIEP